MESATGFSKLCVKRCVQRTSDEDLESIRDKKTPQRKEDAPLFEPQVCGWYSVDSELGNFQGENKNTLMYLHLPTNINDVCFDLTKSYEEDDYKLPITLKENINNVLKWIMYQGKTVSPTAPDADFVCTRGQIVDIMKVPYQQYWKLHICAIKIQETIYLCTFQTDRHEEDQARLTWSAEDLTLSKQGLKFQQFLLSASPDELPDPDQPFFRGKKKSIRLVMRASTGKHSLMYASKNKGLPDAESLMDLQNVSLYDLKTSKNANYKWYQLMNWWTASVVGKVDKMVVGLRGDTGLVRRLQIIEQRELLRRAQETFETKFFHQRDDPSSSHRHHETEGVKKGRSRSSSWRDKKDCFQINWRTGKPLSEPTGKALPKPVVKPKTEKKAEDDPRKFEMYSNCFGFLDDFLSHVKDMMKDEDSPDVVYQFFWSCEDEPNFVHCEKLSPEASVPYRFIPDWYAEWLNTCMPRKK